MKIAVQGCAHGDLDEIYKTVEQLQKENSMKIDLLIICGDFQAVRNPADVQCMAVPPRYRKLNTFYKYYSGVKKAPVLTVFVGGNHEASNFLSELPYGGWVCPNIYYLGYANVIRIGGVRIGGLSGIYNRGRDYFKGRFEYPPYDESSKRSVYHVRNIDVFRLKQIKKPMDIFISHDWPTGVYKFGNKEEVLRWKPFFRNEMDNNTLGSQPAEELLMKLKPSYWFAAHLHCKFAALVPHEQDGDKVYTKFLALDKCLPRRKFLEVIDVESSADTIKIEYDEEWLTILHTTNHLLSVCRRNNFMPGKGCSERWDFTPSEEEISKIQELFHRDFQVLYNFSVTAPIFNPAKQNFREITQLKTYINPQTEKFCEILNLTYPLAVLLNSNEKGNTTRSSLDPNEIELSDDSDDEVETTKTTNTDDDLDVSGSNEFFIDKAGSHSDVKQNSAASDLENFIFPEIKEENSKRASDESDENPKRFKRRNFGTTVERTPIGQISHISCRRSRSLSLAFRRRGFILQ